MYFPRQLFPLTIVLTNLVNLGVSLLLVAAYAIYLNVEFQLTGILFLPLAIVLQFFLVFSIVLLLAGVNVYFRDVEFISGLGIRGWMYLSPIIYPISEIPEKFVNLYMLNPMATIISLYHYVFYGGELVQLNYILYCIAFTFVFFCS